MNWMSSKFNGFAVKDTKRQKKKEILGENIFKLCVWQMTKCRIHIPNFQNSTVNKIKQLSQKVGKRFQQTLQPRGRTDGNSAQERSSASLANREMQTEPEMGITTHLQ